MKRIMALVVMVLIGFSAIANGSNDKEKARVTNYKEVLKSISYPEVCRANGTEGTVWIELKVDRTGSMVNHKIIDSPCSDLTAAVESVIPSLTFEAATTDNGKTRSSKIRIPVVFDLQ